MDDPSVVIEELKAREPLFHRRDLVYSAETFEREAHPDFWEVGASGAVYTRAEVKATILRRLAGTPVDEMVEAGWVTGDHRLMPLGADTYLLTYVLHGQGRVTRRATVWSRSGGAWQALYHQGTVVPDEMPDG
jgi:hypothetical protein